MENAARQLATIFRCFASASCMASVAPLSSSKRADIPMWSGCMCVRKIFLISVQAMPRSAIAPASVSKAGLVSIPQSIKR